MTLADGVSLDLVEIGKSVAQLGATTLLAGGLVVVWRRYTSLLDSLDLRAEKALDRQQKIIEALTGHKEMTP